MTGQAIPQRKALLVLLGVAVVIFLTLVAFRINGSSSSFWYYDLHELKEAKGVIFGSPKPKRSDEWMIWTPAILAQLKHRPPMPVENPSLGAGKAPLLMSLPARHYTMLFRPQLWGFFFLDVERGFSWYWNAKIFGLLGALFLLLFALTSARIGRSMGGAVIISYSSFTQWWFSSPSMLPEMLASWSLALFCGGVLFQSVRWWQRILAAVVVVAAGINFLLCCYPPFEIPLLYLAIAICAGFVWQQRSLPRAGWVWAAGSLIAIVLLLVPVYLELRPTLAVLSHTSYPGARRHFGGELKWTQFFGGLLNFFDGEREYPDVFPNTSEASNFVPLWILAGAVCLVTWWRGRLTGRGEWPGNFPILFSLLIFLLLLSCYQLVGFPGWLATITGLSFTTETRSILGTGFAGMLFVILAMQTRGRPALSRAMLVVFLSAAVLLVAFYLLWNRQWNPIYLTTWRLLSLGVIGAAIAAGYLLLPPRIFLPLLGVLLLWNNFLVNPIAQGLPSLLESRAMQRIEEIRQRDPDALWAGYDRSTLPQFVLASGARVLNGIKVVPPLDLLRQIDASAASREIYNRYAYIVLRLPRPGDAGSHFEYSTPDSYRLFVQPGDPVLRSARLKYVIFRRLLAEGEAPGLSLVEQLPGSQIWIYRLD